VIEPIWLKNIPSSDYTAAYTDFHFINDPCRSSQISFPKVSPCQRDLPAAKNPALRDCLPSAFAIYSLSRHHPNTMPIDENWPECETKRSGLARGFSERKPFNRRRDSRRYLQIRVVLVPRDYFRHDEVARCEGDGERAAAGCIRNQHSVPPIAAVLLSLRQYQQEGRAVVAEHRRHELLDPAVFLAVRERLAAKVRVQFTPSVNCVRST